MCNEYDDDFFEDYNKGCDDDFDDDYDAFDHCDECAGYGDDYFLNDEGELECYCNQCPLNPFKTDDWDD